MIEPEAERGSQQIGQRRHAITAARLRTTNHLKRFGGTHEAGAEPFS